MHRGRQSCPTILKSTPPAAAAGPRSRATTPPAKAVVGALSCPPSPTCRIRQRAASVASASVASASRSCPTGLTRLIDESRPCYRQPLQNGARPAGTRKSPPDRRQGGRGGEPHEETLCRTSKSRTKLHTSMEIQWEISLRSTLRSQSLDYQLVTESAPRQILVWTDIPTARDPSVWPRLPAPPRVSGHGPASLSPADQSTPKNSGRSPRPVGVSRAH